MFKTSCPVYMSIASDVQLQAVQEVKEPRSLATTNPASDPAALAACLVSVVAAVDAARRPVIVASKEIMRAHCVTELAALAAGANLPVASLVGGRKHLREVGRHVVSHTAPPLPFQAELWMSTPHSTLACIKGRSPARQPCSPWWSTPTAFFFWAGI